MDYEGGVSKTPIINTFHYESILNHCFLNRQGENINRGSNIIQRNSNINSNSGIYTNNNNVNAGVYNSGITPTYHTVVPANTSGVYNSGVYQPNTSNVVNTGPLVQPTTGVIYNNDPTYVNPTGVNRAYNANTSGINNN